MVETAVSIQRAMVERAALIQRAMVERAALIQKVMVERAALIQRAMVERAAQGRRKRSGRSGFDRTTFSLKHKKKKFLVGFDHCSFTAWQRKSSKYSNNAATHYTRLRSIQRAMVERVVALYILQVQNDSRTDVAQNVYQKMSNLSMSYK